MSRLLLSAAALAGYLACAAPSFAQLSQQCISFCTMRANNDAVGINECEHNAPVCAGRGRVRGGEPSPAVAGPAHASAVKAAGPPAAQR
jgi:hypothetical protein